MVTVTEILQSVQFVVDREGKPTAAVLNIVNLVLTTAVN